MYTCMCVSVCACVWTSVFYQVILVSIIRRNFVFSSKCFVGEHILSFRLNFIFPLGVSEPVLELGPEEGVSPVMP